MDGKCPKLRRLGFKLRIFQNKVWVGIPKIPAKLCIFQETHKAISQLSVENSIFHMEFMSVVAVVVQALFIILLKIWDVARKKRKYISIASLQELKELGKYEYFLNVEKLVTTVKFVGP